VYTVIVRSKKDRDAVNVTIRKYYSEWGIELLTLKGARTPEKARDLLLDIAENSNTFVIVLLGREDREMARALNEMLPPTAVAHVVPRARVRNARPATIFKETEKARATIRLAAAWDPENNVYVLDRNAGVGLEGYGYSPAYDDFFALGEEFAVSLGSVLGSKPGLNSLILRKMGGLHVVYSGKRVFGTLHIPDTGCSPRGFIRRDVEPIDVELNNLLEFNRHVIEGFLKVSLNFLSRFKGAYDTIAVPWSGGKDSTAALLLALKVFGHKRVIAVYVDTGVDFPQNREYVEKIAKRLSVRLLSVNVSVRNGLEKEGLPLPTHNNRWCTARKVEALKSALRTLPGRVLVILGDRDSESEARSRRPPVRSEEGRTLVAPLKQWATAHVQLFLLMEGVPLNPLYYVGFYRLGCYICPALRSWETYLMSKAPCIRDKLGDDPLFRAFMKHRGCEDFI